MLLNFSKNQTSSSVVTKSGDSFSSLVPGFSSRLSPEIRKLLLFLPKTNGVKLHLSKEREYFNCFKHSLSASGIKSCYTYSSVQLQSPAFTK